MKYHNLYQILLDFKELNSVDIMSNEDFDLEFYRTLYDPVLKRFEPVGDKTFIDNKNRLGSLYIEEFLNGFKDYWINIDRHIIKTSNEQDWDRYKWRKYLYIKINIIKIMTNYSIYKGTEIFIKFVYNIYTHLTLPDCPFIDENEFNMGSYCDIFSNFKNLEYNLKGTLPTYVWESIIKPTCHPAGWVCNYFGNDYSDDGEIISYDNHLRNNLCFIDYCGCNTIINNDDGINFESMYIKHDDIIKGIKSNFQNDVIETYFSLVDSISEDIE